MRSHSTLLLLLLALLWGPTFFYNKLATRELPILTLTAIRVTLATTVLLLSLWWRRRSLMIENHKIKHIFVMSIVASCMPFTFFAWGSRTIDVSLAGVIAGATPLFTALLAFLTGQEKTLNQTKLLGISIGLIGIIALFLPSLLLGVKADLKGASLVLGGVISNAIGFVYARSSLQKESPSVITTLQLLFATLLLVPLALLFDHPFSLPWPNLTTWGATLASAIPGTALVFILYHHLVKTTGATYVSLVTYLLPIIGMILGVCLLDETLHWNFWVGTSLILASLIIVRRSEDESQSHLPTKPACEG